LYLLKKQGKNEARQKLPAIIEMDELIKNANLYK
jgi:hypothetical protein